MRFVTAVLALVFSLAMAGPETHACPIHSPVQGAPVSHHQSKSHPAHCTCPQACCPTACSAVVSPPAVIWSARIPAIRFFDADRMAPAPLLATR